MTPVRPTCSDVARHLAVLALLAVGAAACSVPTESTAEETEAAATSASALSFRLPHVFQGCPAPARDVTIDPKSSELAADEAYFHLWAATVAYGPKEGVEAAAKAAGFTYVKFLDPSTSAPRGSIPAGFQAYVAARNGLTVIAFRGSLTEMKNGEADNTDWVINGLDFTRPGWTVGLPGWVHNGYALQLNEGLPFVKAALAEVKSLASIENKDQPILVSGHSLGGALTTLFSVKLAREGYNIHRAVALAGPRAGDVEFARTAAAELGKRFVRITRPDDIVSMVPPSQDTAELAATISAYGKSDSERREQLSKYSRARFAHVVAPLLLDPATGRLNPTREGEDDGGAAFLKGHLSRIEARVDLPKTEAAAAEMAKAFENHGVEAYGCVMARGMSSAAQSR